MSLSKKLRFEVFKRDSFACVYCGRTPPSVTLHADHVLAVANGGEDIPENLVTSCADCNGGKGARRLEVSALHPTAGSLEHEIERNEQALQYNLYLKQLRDTRESALNDIQRHWETSLGLGLSLEIAAIFRHALRDFVTEQIKEAIDIMAAKGIRGETKCIMYTCGILRKWRQDREARR